MGKADAFRLRASECEEEAELAPTKQLKSRYQRLAEGWRAVSDSQAWLDGEVDPVQMQRT
jgi:hypothetical protein